MSTPEQHRFFGSPITRAIWGNVENIVLIYVGAAAEFALNRDVDWLFFTNRLPSDPMGRFIETFAYNQRVFFSPVAQLEGLGKHVRAIHTAVERKRAQAGGASTIPNRAFIEVNDMLVEYGIRGWEYLHKRTLTEAERESYYQDMRASCEMMGVTDLDADYAAYRQRRESTLSAVLQVSGETRRLYAAYRQALGRPRFWVGALFQAHFVHPLVRQRLGLVRVPFSGLAYRLYPWVRSEAMFRLLAFALFDRKTRSALFRFKRDFGVAELVPANA
ncbi:MAG: DUF2236 domain-containing protein [Anaerolineae bacterium]|jgi:uncharacterized protein (DUF2236 family)|nr:DUF2236 domain-containing protein [Anaerolineae bacterium]